MNEHIYTEVAFSLYLRIIVLTVYKRSGFYIVNNIIDIFLSCLDTTRNHKVVETAISRSYFIENLFLFL